MNSTKIRQRKWRSISAKDLTVIKKTVCTMHHQTSKNIFNSAITVLPWRQTRYNILNDIAKVQNATKRPILTLSQKESRRNWAFKYMKQNWRNVIFTDECRINLNGPDGCKRG